VQEEAYFGLQSALDQPLLQDVLSQSSSTAGRWVTHNLFFLLFFLLYFLFNFFIFIYLPVSLPQSHLPHSSSYFFLPFFFSYSPSPFFLPPLSFNFSALLTAYHLISHYLPPQNYYHYHLTTLHPTPHHSRHFPLLHYSIFTTHNPLLSFSIFTTRNPPLPSPLLSSCISPLTTLYSPTPSSSLTTLPSPTPSSPVIILPSPTASHHLQPSPLFTSQEQQDGMILSSE
jgi:hypothetical protein